MPRIDLTETDTLAKLDAINPTIAIGLIEKGNPADVCHSCWWEHDFGDDVDHPCYLDEEYRCCICNKVLECAEDC